MLYFINTATKYGTECRPATCRMVNIKFLKHHCRAGAGHNCTSLLMGIKREVQVCLPEDQRNLSHCYGAVHKLRHALGEGGFKENVTVCDRGEGKDLV